MKSTAFSLLAVGLLSFACGGGGGGAGNSPSATVTVAFPNLFSQGSSKVLPTYISHLITSQQYPLASITVQNTGPAASLQVSIDLPNYGSASTQMLEVDPEIRTSS
jgi:hypothetical protein